MIRQGPSGVEGPSMRIAMQPSSFHPHLGGVEELTCQLAVALADRGHAVTLHTNRWPKKLAAREVVQGMLVRRHHFRVPERTARQLAGACLAGPSTLAAFVAQLRADRIQILHVQCVSSNAYYALAARRRLNLPLLVTLQGELTMDATGLFQHSAFARALLRRTLAEADLITACSTQTLRDAEAFFGQSIGDRARVIWNGARLDHGRAPAPYPHPRRYALAMGRLVRQKGFDLLVKAFAQANPAGVDLILAGEGPERDALHELAAQLHLEGRVHLIGRADRAVVAALLMGCDFFVLPSRADEGMPVVCAEALTAGRPIIATRAGGAPEALGEDGAAALLVEKEDVSGLAQAMAKLAADAALRARLAAGAAKRGALFNWAVLSGQYEGAYQAAIARFAGGAS